MPKESGGMSGAREELFAIFNYINLNYRENKVRIFLEDAQLMDKMLQKVGWTGCKRKKPEQLISTERVCPKKLEKLQTFTTHFNEILRNLVYFWT